MRVWFSLLPHIAYDVDLILGLPVEALSSVQVPMHCSVVGICVTKNWIKTNFNSWCLS